MLGKAGTTELDSLKRFLSDPNTESVVRCFDKLCISCNQESYDELTKFRVGEFIKYLPSPKTEYIKIEGGTHIGKNRYDTLSRLREICKVNSYKDPYVMFMDPDDIFTNPEYVKSILNEVRKKGYPPNIIEFNYICAEYKRVNFKVNHSMHIQRFIYADPWDINIYDHITGYNYYNPYVRVSGVNKLFNLNEINIDLFKSFTRYEDSLPFAELLSRSKQILIAPFASILYDRKASSVLTSESTTDDILLKLLDYLSSESLPGCYIPYHALKNQISTWIKKKTNES